MRRNLFGRVYGCAAVFLLFFFSRRRLPQVKTLQLPLLLATCHVEEVQDPIGCMGHSFIQIDRAGYGHAA